MKLSPYLCASDFVFAFASDVISFCASDNLAKENNAIKSTPFFRYTVDTAKDMTFLGGGG